MDDGIFANIPRFSPAPSPGGDCIAQSQSRSVCRASITHRAGLRSTTHLRAHTRTQTERRARAHTVFIVAACGGARSAPSGTAVLGRTPINTVPVDPVPGRTRTVITASPSASYSRLMIPAVPGGENDPIFGASAPKACGKPGWRVARSARKRLVAAKSVNIAAKSGTNLARSA